MRTRIGIAVLAAACWASPAMAAPDLKCTREAEATLQKVRDGELIVVNRRESVTLDVEGEADVSMRTRQADPRENWFGDPPKLETAIAALEDAIVEPDGASCRKLLKDATTMLTEAG